MSEPASPASVTCASCGREVSPPPPPETPCPTCGVPLSPASPLEVDEEWSTDKAARIAASEAPKQPRRKGGLILTLVMIVALGVIVVMVMQRSPGARRVEAPKDFIEITVTSMPKPGRPFTVDGAPAGRTPQSLRVKGRTKPLTIEGNGTTVQVTPDHDQIVNLQAPKNSTK